MFIELHKLGGYAITINLNNLEYFTPIGSGDHTIISVPNYNGWLKVEESYEQVKALIANATRK